MLRERGYLGLFPLSALFLFLILFTYLQANNKNSASDEIAGLDLNVAPVLKPEPKHEPEHEAEYTPLPEPEAAPEYASKTAPAPSISLDPVLLDNTVTKAAEVPLLNSLLISHNGDLLSETYFNGANRVDPTNIKSASKSVMSALTGIALDKGYLESIDQKVVDFLPEYVYENMDPMKKDITIRHLLSMTSGLSSTSLENYPDWIASPNWVRNAFQRPMQYSPGEVMIYSSGSSHILSAVLTKATGMSTFEFGQKYLFRPMDITIGGWDRDPQGIYFGGNNMAMSPKNLLKFGQLYLDNGYYNGEEIISSEWVEKSTRKHIETLYSYRDFDYGFYWWLYTFGGEEVYFAWGYGGQFIYVIPDLNSVVVFTSSTELRPRRGGHIEQIQDLLSDEIIPMIRQAASHHIAGN